jgi:hypothetical protein
MFSSMFYSVRSYVYVFNSFCVDICICREMRVQSHSFAFGHSISSIPFIEETVRSPLCVLGTFVENQLTINACTHLVSILFPVSLRVCSYANTKLL